MGKEQVVRDQVLLTTADLQQDALATAQEGRLSVVVPSVHLAYREASQRASRQRSLGS